MRRGVTIAMCGVSGVVVVLTAPGRAATGRPAALAPSGVQPLLADDGTASSPAAAAAPVRTSAAPRATTPRPTTAPKPASYTVTGDPADTRYGPVQVRLTVSRGRITRARAIDYPNGGGRDQEINSAAIPQLDDETLRAQGARIDTVSGATYTSDGYRASLQSALDAAHRAGLL